MAVRLSRTASSSETLRSFMVRRHPVLAFQAHPLSEKSQCFLVQGQTYHVQTHVDQHLIMYPERLVSPTRQGKEAFIQSWRYKNLFLSHFLQDLRFSVHSSSSQCAGFSCARHLFLPMAWFLECPRLKFPHFQIP